MQGKAAMLTPSRAARDRLRIPSTLTIHAAARARKAIEKKPMRAGIWVKLFRAEA